MAFIIVLLNLYCHTAQTLYTCSSMLHIGTELMVGSSQLLKVRRNGKCTTGEVVYFLLETRVSPFEVDRLP
ncbi:hypothetical protein BDQ17DRAFT_1342835 [Cyathus striatus]|nr:hypothetical protein BDQ17DRAFT_1342835 [Cyathus striatus]